MPSQADGALVCQFATRCLDKHRVTNNQTKLGHMATWPRGHLADLRHNKSLGLVVSFLVEFIFIDLC